ncbi:MAG TPA: (2Fe-2S)-binding protein [Terriglobales bacterium]|jgi:xanthine dehydrogenase YagT iron-sulfur-binding subunit|nr:(2Fe-2S)-binding protein [Terriglobales bacterium]
MKDDDAPNPDQHSGLTRRDFIKISGVGAALPLALGPTVVHAAGEDVPVYGPGKTPLTLNVNGKKLTAELEPRVTLLDALRDQFNLTGAKRVCDRGACGACTVLLEGKPVYACSVLAIDVQAKSITTIEGLNGDDLIPPLRAMSTPSSGLTPVMEAFVENDAQQCGFCTPGFVVAATHLLEKHPQPTEDDIRRGLSGNFCRCGTYDGIKAAVLKRYGGGIGGDNQRGGAE